MSTDNDKIIIIQSLSKSTHDIKMAVFWVVHHVDCSEFTNVLEVCTASIISNVGKPILVYVALQSRRQPSSQSWP
jgi:hypothetical protein